MTLDGRYWWMPKLLTVSTSYRGTTVSKLCLIANRDIFSDILDQFEDITTPCIKRCRLQGKVEHHIDTRGSCPVFARARRLAPDKLALAVSEDYPYPKPYIYVFSEPYLDAWLFESGLGSGL